LDQLLTALGMDPKQLTPEQRSNANARLLELLTSNPREIPPQMAQVWMDTAMALLPKAEQDAIHDEITADTKKGLSAHPAAATWEKLLAAYREDRPNDFAAAVDEYNKQVDAAGVPDANVGKNRLEKLLYAPFNSFGHNRVEITFNRFAPFYQCAGLYVIAFVLAMAGFTQHAAGRPHWALAFRRSAFYLLILTFAVHAVALFARMYLMERPLVFVTNLYSSAIFIGLGCVGLCLVIEVIFRLGVGNILAAVLGLVTTIVAHNIATDDTLEMMQAVLDTNFWLATHVTTVTLGYTATFVAGFLGALYVLQMLGAVVRDSFAKVGEPTVGELLAFSTAAIGVVGIPVFFLWFMTNAAAKFELLPSVLLWALFGLVAAVGLIYALALMLLRVGSPGVDAHGKPMAGQVPTIALPITAMALNPERGKIFGQMVYGVVCFATLLSFVGTVLGGIWADQSWGRFWGWDPKENGAVLIVLWNSLILHARWAGLVKDRGVAVLAIVGNMITAWSWFGTNQLSIGLHAYGFDSRLADGCFNFWISQLLILGLGLIPAHFWLSASRRPPLAATIPVAPPTDAPKPQQSTQNPNAPANGTPPANGHVNGHPNGQSNGHHKRDKKKRHGKK
jgi:ABC-type transport system involved in cytochrome c biogenesis permease subunit